MNYIINFLEDEDGSAISEYALMLGLVVGAVAGFVTNFGTRINSTISNATTKLPT